MFSQYLIYLLEKSRFLKVVVVRFIIILFRKRKGIELLYLNYETEHLFDNSYIIIKYRCRNAIYYRFGKHKTLEKQIKIFDLKNLDKEIDFTVYGFFDTKKYKIKLEPQLRLENNNFKTSFSNLSLRLEEKSIPKLIQNIYSDIKKPKIKIPKIKIEQPKLEVSNTTFNQNDFI